MQNLKLIGLKSFNLRLQKLEFVELKNKVRFIKIPPYNANSPILVFLFLFQSLIPTLTRITPVNTVFQRLNHSHSKRVN